MGYYVDRMGLTESQGLNRRACHEERIRQAEPMCAGAYQYHDVLVQKVGKALRELGLPGEQHCGVMRNLPRWDRTLPMLVP
jgi:hypothetical protein